MNNHIYRLDNHLPWVALASLLLLFTIVVMFIGYAAYFKIVDSANYAWVLGSFTATLICGFASGFGFQNTTSKWLVFCYFVVIWVFWVSIGYYYHMQGL